MWIGGGNIDNTPNRPTSSQALAIANWSRGELWADMIRARRTHVVVLSVVVGALVVNLFIGAWLMGTVQATMAIVLIVSQRRRLRSCRVSDEWWRRSIDFWSDRLGVSVARPDDGNYD